MGVLEYANVDFFCGYFALLSYLNGTMDHFEIKIFHIGDLNLIVYYPDPLSKIVYMIIPTGNLTRDLKSNLDILLQFYNDQTKYHGDSYTLKWIIYHKYENKEVFNLIPSNEVPEILQMPHCNDKFYKFNFKSFRKFNITPNAKYNVLREFYVGFNCFSYEYFSNFIKEEFTCYVTEKYINNFASHIACAMESFVDNSFSENDFVEFKHNNFLNSKISLNFNKYKDLLSDSDSSERHRRNGISLKRAFGYVMNKHLMTQPLIQSSGRLVEMHTLATYFKEHQTVIITGPKNSGKSVLALNFVTNLQHTTTCQVINYQSECDKDKLVGLTNFALDTYILFDENNVKITKEFMESFHLNEKPFFKVLIVTRDEKLFPALPRIVCDVVETRRPTCDDNQSDETESESESSE